MLLVVEPVHLVLSQLPALALEQHVNPAITVLHPRIRNLPHTCLKIVVSDDHAGLKKAIFEVQTEGAWQRGYVHFLRNVLNCLRRKVDDDCLQELRWIYDRRDIQEAPCDPAAWIGKWTGKYPKLVDWVEANIAETLTFYRLPRAHHKHLKSTNMLERLNEEIKRRTRVVRIFPNAQSCLRLIRALCVETHETWLEDSRYLNMMLRGEQKKELLLLAPDAASRCHRCSGLRPPPR